MIDISLMNSVLLTMGVLITMSIITCLCCIGMKISDQRLKTYIIQTADRKGIPINLDKILDPNHVEDPPETSEVCTIMIPDVGIVH